MARRQETQHTTKKQVVLQRINPLQITKKSVANIILQRHLQRTQSVRNKSFQIWFATDNPLQIINFATD